MEGNELKMMGLIVRNSIDRDITTDYKMNELSKQMKQDHVPDQYFELVRAFNDLSLYITNSLANYLDQEISIEEAIGQISKMLNQITNTKKEGRENE